jgi:hypothetical protein
MSRPRSCLARAATIGRTWSSAFLMQATPHNTRPVLSTPSASKVAASVATRTKSNSSRTLTKSPMTVVNWCSPSPTCACNVTRFSRTSARSLNQDSNLSFDVPMGTTVALATERRASAYTCRFCSLTHLRCSACSCRVAVNHAAQIAAAAPTRAPSKPDQNSFMLPRCLSG